LTLNPRVKIDVQENITLTTPGGPAIIALMGTAQWGALNELKTFSSFSQLLSYYKEDKSGLTLIKGADLAYNNGAVTIKAIRVADGDEAKASIALDGDSGSAVGVLTFSGLYEGTYGNNILVTVTDQGTGRIVEITDGISTEEYTNDNDANGYATNAAIAAAINAGSSLVSVEVKSGSETIELVDAAANQALTGGDDGEDSLADSAFTTAFDSYLDNVLWDLMIIPGDDALQGSDAFQTTMLGKVNTRATSSKKYGMYITGVKKDETISTISARTMSGERGVLCAPNIKYTPRYTGASEAVFNGTYLACALAGKIASADVEISPTRKVLTVSGLSVDSTTGKEYYNNGEIEQLLTTRIVPVSDIEGSLKVARGVTRYSDKTSIYFEINIVRIIDYIKASTQVKLDPFLGDPNLDRVRGIMATAVDAILQQAQLDEVVAAYEPTEVVEGVSPDTVNVNMTIQPTFAVNFINVTLTVSRL